MKLFYRLLRTVLVVAIVLVAVVPALLYVALSLPSVQRMIADKAQTELTQLLGADVKIGSLGIIPFNKVILRDVTIETAPGDTALTVHRLGAGVSIFDAIALKKYRVDYLELIGANARLRRDSVGAPLNIQPIIDALQPKDKTKPPTRFDLKISTVIIRSCTASYDIQNQPIKEPFDPNHIKVSNLRADINLPRIANDDFTVKLRRLALQERSGLTIDNLTGEFHIAANELTSRNLEIKLPSSTLGFTDISLPIEGFKNIADALQTEEIELQFKEGAHIWLPDLRFLIPALDKMRVMATFPQFDVKGNTSAAHAKLKIELEDLASINFDGEGWNLENEGRRFKINKLEVSSAGRRLNSELMAAGLIPAEVAPKLDAVGPIELKITGDGSQQSAQLTYALACDLGSLGGDASGEFTISQKNYISSKNPNHLSSFSLEATLQTEGYFDLTPLGSTPWPLGFEGTIEGDYSQIGKARHGNLELIANQLNVNNVELTGIQASATLDDDFANCSLTVDDPDVSLTLDGETLFAPSEKSLKANLQINRLIPDRLGLWQKYPGAVVAGDLDVDLSGTEWLKMEGKVELSDAILKPVDSQGITLKKLTFDALNLNEEESRYTLESDYLDGRLQGAFDLPGLGHSILDVGAAAFPALLPAHDHDKGANHHAINDFVYDFTIKPCDNLAEFFHLPVSVIYPVKLRGGISDEVRDLEFNLSAPYLRQGNKLIENTSLSAYVDGDDERARLNFTTTAPTKGGPMTLNLSASGHDDKLRAELGWKIDRARAYEGNIKTVTDFARIDNELLTTIGLRKSSLTFNDSTWTIDPATISIRGKEIAVDGLNAYHSNQFVKINGNVSTDPLAMLTLELRHFSLDYLFESLGIDAAMLGGDASGTFYASNLYSGHPALETPGLTVKNISYNHTVLGDALVRSRFNPETMAAELAADIDNGGRKSTVDGAIFATRDSLDLIFHVDREPVGFLQPYMEAFASDIKGYASGWARVYGNFKYIDLEGDVYADSVQMRVNFTNTTYWATDSVHIRPGYIDLNGITVHDFRGNSAQLNGWVRHQFFKEPRFEFSITGAKNLLCYDETPKENPRWYGRIFGNGGAHVKGAPGVVDISVDMSTAPGSTFTFVLSDQIEAEQYSFLTFRDKGKLEAEMTDTLHLRDTSLDLVNRLRQQAANHDVESSSDYNITIQMGITPDAQINLVMDPIGGDRIRSFGSGHIRMDYGSANNELKMFGNYTLDRGDYNFTLQDIIIKDFTIKPGSEISFRGDPYAAQLDIQAAYSLNANLSDLDESFLNDSELQRTNVPVNAIMEVSGDIREPELAFDLEFPTLTSDVYRKVRSIISTDDMMNRQILYLLALNRFYTPDYMAGATRGNELVSVASSTISSQLSSILGQISDNWNIAPQFRSSRGDFSDVEVDVALSSRLLNNRLLFNGNLGYRDKSLNTNQFVGDFDLEYLLNRSGNFRLKAYNRYNDQNYYLRSALTTQGVGIVLRKDFDSLTSFMRPLLAPFRRKKVVTIPLAIPTDTIRPKE